MSSRKSPRLGVWVVTLALGWVMATTSPASEMGQLAADQVSLGSYYDFMDDWLYTHTGHNRGPNGAQHDPCRDNIVYLMQSYGLDVHLEVFNYSGYQFENVVGTKLGTVYPNKEYIIGAHYDSVSNPGADDNASGVALVLEAARILTQYESEYTIRFIAFDAEELGLIGSDHYVDLHFGDDIRGMISADMVAYDPNTNRANIYGRTASNPIKNSLAAAVAEYGNGLTCTIGGDTPYSDHAPFEAAGFQACLLIEGEVWNNPYYHTQQDNFENPNNLNFAYAVKMTRSVVGWLVDQAGVLVEYNGLKFTYPDGQPEYVSPAGGTRMRVQVTGVGEGVPEPGTGRLYYNTGTGWQSVPMQEVSPNVYDAIFPGAACGTKVKYYVSANAVGGQVFTDPRQAPTTYYQATAGYGCIVFYENTLTTNPGWTTQGLWAFGQPTGGGGQYGGPDPTSGYTGPYVYGYNLNGDYENNLPERHLTSGAINCTGMGNVHLTFWRWLGVEQPSCDHAYVRVSNNGTSWTTVWQNPSEIADHEWHYMDLDISAVADNKSTVYLRWTMGTTDSGWRYCGWNIDDIRLTALRCEAYLGDLNCDNSIDGFDIQPFVLALTNPAAYEGLYPNCNLYLADCNMDGAIDGFDIQTFVELLTD